MAYRIAYSDYSTTATGPPDPERWVGPPGPQGPTGPVGPQGPQGIAGNPFPEAPNNGPIYGRGGATVAWVPTLPLSGGTLSGALALAGGSTAPTPTVGDSSTQIATTSFVGGAIATATGGLLSQTTADGRYLQLSGGALSGGLTLNAGGTFTGTIAGTHTYSGAITYSVSGGFGLSVPNSSVVFGAGAVPGFLRLQGQAGTTRQLQFSTNNVSRWTFAGSNLAESGNNSGSRLEVSAYQDSGTFAGFLLQAERTSGGLGLGSPTITSMAPWTQSTPRAVIAGANIGNYQNFFTAGNTQPVATLAANPIATTSGSTTVTVTWTGAASANGPLGRLQYETWVKLSGVTAVGGITPNGWVNVVSAPDADHFTFTWTSPATSTATGGGSSVTAQPSFSTMVNTLNSTETSGAYGFLGQTTELWNVDPYWLPDQASPAPRYLQRWHWTCGPVAAADRNFALAGIEWDLTNRGTDQGYHPNAGNALQNTTGMWIGATVIPSWATGGGTATNWGSVFNIYSLQLTYGIGVYNPFVIQPNALVSAARDPTGHGGVGFEAFGSLLQLPGAPFTTSTGTSTISIHTAATGVAMQNPGDTVWLPTQYTVAGVTFGNGLYTINSVNKSTGDFTITGTGTASAVASGGPAAGPANWIAFSNMVPYAPFQAQGSYKHGIISNNARFESGGIIETQPGNGMLWNDGTGTASINSSAISAGNLNLDLWPAGTGQIIAHGQIVAPNILRPVATAGSASVTGTISETNLAALRVPAAAMGLNGWLVVTAIFSYTNNANSKTLQGRFNPTPGSVAGAPVGSFAVTTTGSAQLQWIVRNNNSAAAQNTFVSPNAPFGAAGANPLPTTTNTAADSFFNINGLCANAADTITLVHAGMVIYSA